MVSSIQDIAPSLARIKTGIAGLDQILGGGFLHGNSVLIQGTPGAGKTALAMQIIANGVLLHDDPAIILSFEQFPQQLYRDALSFGWNLADMERARKLRVIFARPDDLYSSFPEKEGGAISAITDASIELHARRLLVDSASMFWRLPLSPEEQRKIFFEFVMKLKGLNLTPFLTSEIESTREEFAPEEFAVDTILKLEHRRANEAVGGRARSIEVIKARAQQIAEGKHPFRITNSGVLVFPYVKLPAMELECQAADDQRCHFGVKDIDDLLGGGIEPNATVMLAGMTGTGKTTLAAHFIAAALQAGQAGLFVTLNERPAQLMRNMDLRGLGFSEAAADNRLVVLHATGAGLQLMEFYYTLKELIESLNVKRVVIDGLRGFLSTTEHAEERNYYLTLFRELFRSAGATSIFTWNIQDVAGLTSLASVPHSAMMDNVLYTGLLELESKLRKVIAVFKSRGCYADASLRELIITAKEVKISHLFAGVSGILQGSASGNLTDVGRQVLTPLMHIREFVNTAEVNTPQQAKAAIESIRAEFNVLAALLHDHFSFTKY